jgi:hypothetical protein
MRSAHAMASQDGFRAEEAAAGGAIESLEDKRARLRALRRIQYDVESFEAFVGRMQPLYMPVPHHLRPLYNLIERSRHEPIRALVSMPPRHGKSQTLIYALAWRCLYDPAVQNIYATFTSDLAEEHGRAVRVIAQAAGVQVGKVASNSNKAAGSAKVLDWKTSYGGGLKSTSVGGSVTGRPCHGLMIIDDPIKGQEAAQSLGERSRVWSWLKSDILSRLEGGGSCIIVQTRWHEDDPIGRMLNGGADWVAGLGEEWVHINLAAIHDGSGNPVDERLQPEHAHPLWPSINARYPNSNGAALDWYRICRARGEYEWWSLYQGVPRSKDQKVFAEDPTLYVLPISMLGRRAMIMLDPAATAKTSSDFSALGCFTMTGYGDATVKMMDRKGNEIEVLNPDPSVMDVVEAVKHRWPAPKMLDLAYEWQTKRYRMGGAILKVGVEVDGTGANLPDWIERTNPKLKITPVLSGGRDKYTRAIGVGKAWNQGRVRVPDTKDHNGDDVVIGWDVADYIRVLKAFTGLGDIEDDLVDITAHAFNRLYKPWRNDGRRSIQMPAY